MATYGVYATAEQIKEYLTKEPGRFVDDDQRLMRFAVQATERFNRECKRQFRPVRETRLYDHPGSFGGAVLQPSTGVSNPHLGNPTAFLSLPSVLCLDEDLLEIVTLTTQNGGTTITSSDYLLKSGDNYNRSPYDRIELKTNGTQTVFLSSGTTQQSNSVDGYWGYHDDWDNAWVQVDTVQDNPLSSSAASVTVADADGADEMGFTPRFQRQQLVRFGSSSTAEYAYVIGKNNDADTIDVVRGVNGTTAAEQAQSTAIYVYRPMWDIVEAMQLLAVYSYRRKDSVGNADDRGLASSTGVLVLPPKLPEEVSSAISGYKRILMGGGW